MDTWGALTNATSVMTRDDLSIRRKTVIVSQVKRKEFEPIINSLQGLNCYASIPKKKEEKQVVEGINDRIKCIGKRNSIQIPSGKKNQKSRKR